MLDTCQQRVAQWRQWLTARPLHTVAVASALLLLLVLLLLLALRAFAVPPAQLPDFAAITETEERKAAFFAYLLPMVNHANAQVMKDRLRLNRLYQRMQSCRLGKSELRWLNQQAAHYGLDSEAAALDMAMVEELLLRMDVIAPSLALAQAALESGWGRSRFAREANNLFGVWCYTPGCGMVPAKRPAGASHEVLRYASVLASLEDYIRLLNSNPAYRSLWDIRRSLRDNDQTISGLALAAGLYRYSQEGSAYVTKVGSLIRSNQLEIYD